MKRVLTVLFLSVILFTLAGCDSKKTAEYRTDLQNVAGAMLDNASKAEEIVEYYAIVWNHSIKSRGAIPVEEMSTVTGIEQDVIQEYFEINNAGNIPNDFSINIHSLNAYYEGTGQLEEIKNTSDDIKNKISELNEPPKEYKKVYDEVLDMYNLSEKYIEMALNPSGSLQSFNEDKKQLSDDIVSKYKRIEVIMPSKD